VGLQDKDVVDSTQRFILSSYKSMLNRSHLSSARIPPEFLNDFRCLRLGNIPSSPRSNLVLVCSQYNEINSVRKATHKLHLSVPRRPAQRVYRGVCVTQTRQTFHL